VLEILKGEEYTPLNIGTFGSWTYGETQTNKKCREVAQKAETDAEERISAEVTYAEEKGVGRNWWEEGEWPQRLEQITKIASRSGKKQKENWHRGRLGAGGLLTLGTKQKNKRTELCLKTCYRREGEDCNGKKKMTGPIKILLGVEDTPKTTSTTW